MGDGFFSAGGRINLPPENLCGVKFRLIECNYFAKGTYSTPLGPFTGAARSACAA